jgi:hypothetical protein
MNKPDGYRYVRSYDTKARKRIWRRRLALFEVHNGRAKRMGTVADTDENTRAWLRMGPPTSEVAG